MSTSGVGATSGSSSSSSTDSSTHANKSLSDLDISDFLSLLITEMQQQDPMNPMDNAQMMEQISQIRAIQSNTQLTETLKSVGLGQNIATASSLIGQQITGLTAAGSSVKGVVDKVTVSGGDAVVHVGGSQVPLSNVQTIQPATSSS